jgi:hypothetical protein
MKRTALMVAAIAATVAGITLATVTGCTASTTATTPAAKHNATDTAAEQHLGYLTSAVLFGVSS